MDYDQKYWLSLFFSLIWFVVVIWWTVDLLIFTFGPLSLYQLWNREAKLFSLPYVWFVVIRLTVVFGSGLGFHATKDS